MLSSLVIVAIYVLLLCFFFAPKWQTNDDVGMSMMAHGYGIAPICSPNILFSNVLWGYLVRAIPEINGVLGYSIATLSVLVLVGTVLIYCLRQLGIVYVACLSTFVLILTRPVLFPQFTINAGLLSVGAIICWHLYAQQQDKRALVTGCLLAFLSYLVRSQEFYLVLIVALPLLPLRTLFLSRFAQIALLILVSAIAISAVIDYQAYQSNDWQVYNALNPARAPFTDYNAGQYLKQRPDILARYGYSINDIDLITDWFFVDSHIANPEALQAMLTELGPLPAQSNALTNAWLGVQTLWHPILLTTVLTALLLAVLRPAWHVAASWGLCIAAVFALGLLGRPGVLHVYVPVTCLLLTAPLLKAQVFSNWRNQLSIVVLLVAAAVNMAQVFHDSKTYQLTNKQIQQDFASFPNFIVVIWRGTFPYEAIYPVLGVSSAAMSYRHYGLGTSTLNPFTVADVEQKAGRGMINLLVKEEGIPIMAAPPDFNYLEIYCKEHFQGQLKELSIKQYGTLAVSQRRCEPK
jgi:hypothetical protein